MKIQPASLAMEHPIPLETSMNTEKLDKDEQQEFPPWSAKVIFLWFIIGLVLPIKLTGYISGYVVAWTSITLKLGLAKSDIIYIARSISMILRLLGILVFVILQLRMKRFSLRNVWISTRLNVRDISFSLLLGMLLALLGTIGYRLIIGEFTVRHQLSFSGEMDWRIALSLDMLTLVFVTGVVEEILFRGLIYQALRKHFSTVRAALLSTSAFSAVHLTLFIVNMICIFLLGLAAVVLFERTRSLSNCVSLHFAYNATGIIIYYLVHVIPGQ